MSIDNLLNHDDAIVRKYGDIIAEVERELKAGNLSQEEAVEILEDIKHSGELTENNNSIENAALVQKAIDVILKII